MTIPTKHRIPPPFTTDLAKRAQILSVVSRIRSIADWREYLVKNLSRSSLESRRSMVARLPMRVVLEVIDKDILK